MKKLKGIILATLAGLTLVGCDDTKNDKTAYTQPDFLKGTWVVKQTGRLNAQAGIDFTDFDNGTCPDDSYVFGSDKTFTKRSFVAGGTACTEETQTGTYERSNHSLVLKRPVTEPTPGTVTTFCNITKLSNDELEFNYNDPSGQLLFLVLSKE